MVRVLALLLAAPAVAAPMSDVQARLDALVRSAPGRFGVAVLDLDSGARATVRGRTPAPMASVFKLPTAVAVLHRAQEESLPLSTVLQVRAEERAPGWSPLAARVPPAGLDLTLQALLESMVTESDNTAADVLLRWMGGPGEVIARLARLAVRGIRIDRNERGLSQAAWGLTPVVGSESLEALLARSRAVPAAQRRDAFRSFSKDPRDQASPEALVELLASLHSGKLLDPPHTRGLLATMRATPTGPRRLRAGLPTVVSLAHKTGLLASEDGFSVAVNDVGIASAPGRNLAIAVLVTDAEAPVEQCEDLIAAVARAAWRTDAPAR